MALRVCVTGGAGFVGTHTVARLLAAGAEVLVVDDLSREGTEPPANAAFAQVDVCDFPRIRASLTAFRPDAVVHLAARTSATATGAEAVTAAQVNVAGTAATLEAAAAAGAKRFVLMSSAAVYGDPPADLLPLDEDAPLAPIAPYGASKVAAEEYVRALTRGGRLQGTVLRPSNMYGPLQRSDLEGGVVARFCAAMGGGAPPTIYGDGLQVRDYVFVGDVADAIARALESDAAAGQTLNISTGVGCTVLELFGKLADLTGYRGEPAQATARQGDIRDSRLDPRRAAAILGWRARTSLEQGLRQTLAASGRV
jgi:UDP-glucose 4-epimerase